jgi:hypothetical protein
MDAICAKCINSKSCNERRIDSTRKANENRSESILTNIITQANNDGIPDFFFIA